MSSNEEYIEQNRDKDVRQLALQKMPEGVDAKWVLRQIEGYQLALKKLPRWAEVAGLHYPPRLSMEQCSSEATAQYKSALAKRLLSMGYGNNDHEQAATADDRKLTATTDGCEQADRADGCGVLVDLTGGFGVDFSYMARPFGKAIYVERQEELCQAARHNFPLLGLMQAEVIACSAEEFLDTIDVIDPDNKLCDIAFLDPARRDDAGKKTIAISDCTPDLSQLQEQLLSFSRFVIVKLSPMLDITMALRTLHHVSEVHVVSVKGECKELLFVMTDKVAGRPDYHCVNLGSGESDLILGSEEIEEARNVSIAASPQPGQYLFEPNASIMKAGMQDAFAASYGLQKLHPMSNLFIGTEPIASVPARQFIITGISDFSKASLKAFLKDIPQANLTIRNFPSTVADLRKRLKIKEGGSVYLFATTLSDGSHVLISASKAG